MVHVLLESNHEEGEPDHHVNLKVLELLCWGRGAHTEAGGWSGRRGYSIIFGGDRTLNVTVPQVPFDQCP